MNVQVLWIGKTRLPGVAALTEEYSKRLGRYCVFRGSEVHTTRKSGGSRQEGAMAAEALGGYRVVLDPAGKQWSSKDFTYFLSRFREQRQQTISFCVGGADGFSEDFRRQADLLL